MTGLEHSDPRHPTPPSRGPRGPHIQQTQQVSGNGDTASQHFPHNYEEEEEQKEKKQSKSSTCGVSALFALFPTRMKRQWMTSVWSCLFKPCALGIEPWKALLGGSGVIQMSSATVAKLNKALAIWLAGEEWCPHHPFMAIHISREPVVFLACSLLQAKMTNLCVLFLYENRSY
jgi:hypothetical protein